MGTAITGSCRVSFKRVDTFSSGLSTDIANSIEPRPVSRHERLLSLNGKDYISRLTSSN